MLNFAVKRSLALQQPNFVQLIRSLKSIFKLLKKTMAKSVNFTQDHTKEQIAYLAGLVDGEGCFYIGRTKQGKYGSGFQWHSMLKITSCDEELIVWLEKTFGGSKDSRYRWTSKKKFVRPVYNWQATGAMLDYLLPLIEPYLIIKKRQCSVMMHYRLTSKNIGSRRLSPEISTKRFELMVQLRALNSRFSEHILKQKAIHSEHQR